MNKFTNRQNHGNYFESKIIKRYGFIPETEYRYKWDAYEASTGTPVSIKYSEVGSEIVMADLFRQAELEEDRFIMIVGFWEGDVSNLVDIYILEILSKDWEKLFDIKALMFYDKMLQESKCWGAGDNHDYWLAKLSDGNDLWRAFTPNILKPRPRRDPNRIQCAIRYNDFIKHFVEDDGGMFISNRVSRKDSNGLMDNYVNNHSVGDITQVNSSMVQDEKVIEVSKESQRVPHKPSVGAINYWNRVLEMDRMIPRSSGEAI